MWATDRNSLEDRHHAAQSQLRAASASQKGRFEAAKFGARSCGRDAALAFQALDLEASPVCVSDLHDKTTNTWTSPYLDCPIDVVHGADTPAFGQINWQLGGAVRTPYMMR